MAEIYREVHGKPIEEWLAGWKPVQAHLFGRAHRMRMDAAIDLGRHKDQGHSYIELEHGRIDYHIVLNDTRGQRAAMSIEYGRQGTTSGPGEAERGAMEGLYILHRATGLGGM